ncbi:MAG: nuclear transport factor 2 family protein [Algoriphagus sp.]|uniref:nuclear transport factor 2 family protein n=1 Tax=Algoriphagus sp. TaxID=1872435 RepID=UPI002735A571|nr:nuclear transport factor 2 family protein [Algoriphagus sp.]MDP3471946.1 nuclear transport factor 2 family protein [Algoriphagus sp.]
MKKYLFVFTLIILSASFSFGQSTQEQEIKKLSMDKWQWMADKDIAKLTPLFHPQAKFVHMSGTWTTARELEIIETGSIWYKKADVKDTAIEIVGNTAIVWNRITLTAEVRGSDVVTEFTVTEVYQKDGAAWKMLALTFSSVRDTHQLEK